MMNEWNDSKCDFVIINFHDSNRELCEKKILTYKSLIKLDQFNV